MANQVRSGDNSCDSASLTLTCSVIKYSNIDLDVETFERLLNILVYDYSIVLLYRKSGYFCVDLFLRILVKSV